ncbi:MAG TPA: zinc ribbon domain-containing protein [Ktedonobacteraceae bacterium]|nr:zinc ribbon domain-containing protein [Ktedonobacteraceae bacterium]
MDVAALVVGMPDNGSPRDVKGIVMLFCGNCGFRLAPGDRQCPRCGTAIDPDLLATDEDAQPDAPTTASPSLLGRMQPSQTRPPGPTSEQQKLILRPGQNAGNFGPQDGNEATRRVDASGYDYGATARRAPSNADMHTSYPGYPQQNSGYPPQQAPYPGYQQGANDYTQSPPTNFAPQENMGYQTYSGQYQAPQAPQANTSAKGRSAALVIILLGLLLILIALTLFVLQHNGVVGASGAHPIYNLAQNMVQ